MKKSLRPIIGGQKARAGTGEVLEGMAPSRRRGLEVALPETKIFGRSVVEFPHFGVFCVRKCAANVTMTVA